MAYYLGIDGGGSKTTCAIGDESSLLATAVAGPSNLTRVTKAEARESLHMAVRQTCASAKISATQVARACIGVAGAGRDEVAAAIRQIAAEVIHGEIEVVGDMRIALAAAFGEGPGVIVIAGTGSIAYGRDRQGKTARAGGWGFGISDEGSAYWIGRAAVSAVLRAIDESSTEEKNVQALADSQPLLGEVIAAWKLHSFDEFMRTVNSSPDFAALFPAIQSASDRGNSVAQSVLSHAGRELAKLAAIVARRLFAQPDDFSIPLAMAGGVFRHSPRVRDVFRDEIRRTDARLVVNPEVVEPVTGALQLARLGLLKKPQ